MSHRRRLTLPTASSAMWSVTRTRAGWQVVEWPGPNPVSEAFPTERAANAFMAALAAPDDAGSETIVRREWPGYGQPRGPRGVMVEYGPPRKKTQLEELSDLAAEIILSGAATKGEIKAAVMPALRLRDVTTEDAPAVLARLQALKDRKP